MRIEGGGRAVEVVPGPDDTGGLAGRVGPRADAGRLPLRVGHVEAGSIASELPAVEGAADPVALDLAAHAEVGAEMRTVSVESIRAAFLGPEHHELLAEVGAALAQRRMAESDGDWAKWRRIEEERTELAERADGLTLQLAQQVRAASPVYRQVLDFAQRFPGLSPAGALSPVYIRLMLACATAAFAERLPEEGLRVATVAAEKVARALEGMSHDQRQSWYTR